MSKLWFKLKSETIQHHNTDATEEESLTNNERKKGALGGWKTWKSQRK